MGRRERREAARILAKEIVQAKAAMPQMEGGEWLGWCLAAVLALVLFLLASKVGPRVAAFCLLGIFLLSIHPIRKIKFIGAKPKIRFPLALAAMALLVSAFGYHVWPESFEKLDYIEGWGPVLPFPESQAMQIRVDGRLLYSYRESDHLAAVAYKYEGTEDPKDLTATGLLKSGLFDIENRDLIIRVPVNAKLLQLLNSGALRTNYSLLLVPNGIQMEQFSTLREAEALGVKILDERSGPP